MQSTLHEHILHLEHLIQALTDKLTDPSHTSADRHRLSQEVQVAELSLMYYRKAFELEQQLNPLSRPGKRIGHPAEQADIG
jgi:hypothetical protein